VAPTAYDTIAQVLNVDPMPVRRLQTKVPRDLETICLKCLDKDPARRYGSARELAEDLQRFFDGVPIHARPITWVGRAWKWARRRPMIAGLLAALAAAIVTGFSASTWFILETQQANRETRKARRLSDRRLYVSNIRLVERAWEDNHQDWQRELLDAVAPEATDGIDLRCFEWHFWKRISKPLLHVPADYAGAGMAFRPDSMGITAIHQNQLQLWRFAAATGEPVGKPEEKKPDKITWSPDGKYVASCAGAEIRVRNQQGELLFSRQAHQGARTLAFSADNRWLASGGRDGAVRLWDLQQPGEGLALGKHDSDVIAVAFGETDSLVASLSTDGILKLWDVKKREIVRTFADQADRDRVASSAVAFSPREPLLAAGLKDGRIILWNTKTKARVQEFRAHVAYVSSVAFSPDGRRLASVCGEAKGNEPLRVWNVATGQEWSHFRGPRPPAAQVQFSPDGTMLACGAEGAICVWKLAEHASICELSESANPVYDVACSPDGKRIASTAEDRVEILDRSTGKTTLAQQHDGNVLCVAFHPRLPLLASGGDDQTVKLWDYAANKELATLNAPAAVLRMAFHPTLRRLAAVDADKVAHVWNFDDEKPLYVLRNVSANYAAFTLDGQRVVLGRDDGDIGIHDAETGKELDRLKAGRKAVTALAFHPNGRWLASGGDDHLVLWDFATRTELHRFKGHANQLNSLAFSPDGRRLASATEDGLLRLWDVDSAEEVFSWRHAGGPFTCVLFTPDGNDLIAGHHRRTELSSHVGGISQWSVVRAH
jgi:WD40 repeat protein